MARKSKEMSELQPAIGEYMKDLVKRDPRIFDLKPNAFGQTGVADFGYLIRGAAVWLEAKDLHKITPMQLKQHRDFRSAGGYVYIVRSLDDAIQVVDWWLNRAT